MVAVSDSQGGISLVEVSQSGPSLLQHWKAHQFEAWIVSFGSDQHTVFSGGDDCRLCQWDTRADTTKPTFTSKRYVVGYSGTSLLWISLGRFHCTAIGACDMLLMTLILCLCRHTMGVCSLQMHPDMPHLLSSGRYIQL